MQNQPLHPQKGFVFERTLRKRRVIKRQSIENYVRRRVRKADLMNLRLVFCFNLKEPELLRIYSRFKYFALFKYFRYLDFFPLYELWCQYYSNLLGISLNHPDERILKADYHGCIFIIADAAASSQVWFCFLLSNSFFALLIRIILFYLLYVLKLWKITL